jgi:hypothetical protein
MRLRLALRGACGTQLRCRHSVLGYGIQLRLSLNLSALRRGARQRGFGRGRNAIEPRAARDSGAVDHRLGALNRETLLPLLAAVGPHAHSGDLWGGFLTSAWSGRAGPAEMSNRRTSATSLPPAVLAPLAAQAHRYAPVGSCTLFPQQLAQGPSRD